MTTENEATRAVGPAEPEKSEKTTKKRFRVIGPGRLTKGDLEPDKQTGKMRHVSKAYPAGALIELTRAEYEEMKTLVEPVRPGEGPVEDISKREAGRDIARGPGSIRRGRHTEARTYRPGDTLELSAEDAISLGVEVRPFIS